MRGAGLPSASRMQLQHKAMFAAVFMASQPVVAPKIRDQEEPFWNTHDNRCAC